MLSERPWKTWPQHSRELLWFQSQSYDVLWTPQRGVQLLKSATVVEVSYQRHAQCVTQKKPHIILSWNLTEQRKAIEQHIKWISVWQATTQLPRFNVLVAAVEMYHHSGNPNTWNKHCQQATEFMCFSCFCSCFICFTVKALPLFSIQERYFHGAICGTLW